MNSVHTCCSVYELCSHRAAGSGCGYKQYRYSRLVGHLEEVEVSALRRGAAEEGAAHALFELAKVARRAWTRGEGGRAGAVAQGGVASGGGGAAEGRRADP